MVNKQKRAAPLRPGPRDTHAPLAAAIVIIVLASMVPLAGAGLIARLASSERSDCESGSILPLLSNCAAPR